MQCVDTNIYTHIRMHAHTHTHTHKHTHTHTHTHTHSHTHTHTHSCTHSTYTYAEHALMYIYLCMYSQNVYSVLFPVPVIDNAWRNCDWSSMREGIAQAEQVCPEALIPRLQLYKGYIAVCPVEDQHLSLVSAREAECCTGVVTVQ